MLLESLDTATKSNNPLTGRVYHPTCAALRCTICCAVQPYHQQYLARGGRNGAAQDPSKGCTGELANRLLMQVYLGLQAADSAAACVECVAECEASAYMHAYTRC
jgi:hypothetical protein